MISFVQKRPWILVIVAFVVLIASWVFLLRLAAEHQPDSVEIITIQPDDKPEP